MKDLGVVIFAYAPESPRNAILAYAPGQAPTTSARCDTCLRPRLAALAGMLENQTLARLSTCLLPTKTMSLKNNVFLLNA